MSEKSIVSQLMGGNFDVESSKVLARILNSSAHKGEQGPKGDKGEQGAQGIQGRDGKDGKDGRDGRNGLDGRDGKDGRQGPKGDKGDSGDSGVSVVDAELAVDGHLVFALSNGNLIDVGDISELTDKPLVVQTVNPAITDVAYSITDAAAFEIDPANGSIQTVTLGASRTPKATNFASGQVVMIGINDGSAYTVTWTTVAVTWVKPGGTASAPTLATSGYTWVLLWKVGSTIYGAEVGKP